MPSLPRTIVELLKSVIKNFGEAVRHHGVYAFPALMAYIYRRLGYLRGIALAYDQLKHLQRGK